MKKLVLLGSFSIFLGSLTAQNAIVYEDFHAKKLGYYTNNPTPITKCVNPSKTGINSADSVGRFDRAIGNPPSRWTLVSCAPTVVAGGDWGTFDMATFPILTMNIFAQDSLNVRIIIKDKINFQAPDLESFDYKYTLDNKGTWQKITADFSHRVASTWPSKVELQIYFSYGVAKDITVYYDSIIGHKPSTITGLNSINTTGVEIKQNAPNPATDITHIGYSMEKNENVSIKVYDILGANVATLVNEKQEAGSHSAPFDVSLLQSGLYYYTVKIGNVTQTNKIQVLK